MSPQTSEQLQAKPTVAPVSGSPLLESPGPATPSQRLRPRTWTPGRTIGWWLLLLLGVLLNIEIVHVTYMLVAARSKQVEENLYNPIAIPYARNKELLDKFRGWETLENGRRKPFGTY